MGINDLRDYIDMKMARDEISKEKQKNLKEAKSLNKLVYNVYFKY